MGSVDRIDDPDRRPTGMAHSAFLPKKGIVGEVFREDRDDVVLASTVGFTDQILRALVIEAPEGAIHLHLAVRLALRQYDRNVTLATPALMPGWAG